MKNHTLLITGGAGYIGCMLADQYARRGDVEKIILIDKDNLKERDEKLLSKYKENQKIIFIQQNLADNSWQSLVKSYQPDIVIHTAWQIREMYGDRQTSWRWNIEGSNNIFDFCFENSFVKRLVYFSTVASYGAYTDNTLDKIFTEESAFRKGEYLYAEEKRLAEESLDLKYAQAKAKDMNLPIISIIRPASITGPRVKSDKQRFGLQSALSGSFRGGLSALVRTLTRVLPVTQLWARQYVHEDDICNIVELLSFDQKVNHNYEAFNACPPGEIVTGERMAQFVGKKKITLHPKVVQAMFAIFWHLTHGKVPTVPGSWKGYSYPIVVDGSKITRLYNYTYTYKTDEAFTTSEGRYK